MSTELVKLDEMHAAMLGGFVPEEQSPEEASRQIVEAILLAEDVSAVFAGAGAEPWQDALNVPVILRGMRINRSSFEGAVKVYGVFDVIDARTEKAKTLTCGGRNVMAQALRLMQLDALPIKVRLVEAGRETAAGFKPLWLEPVADGR